MKKSILAICDLEEAYACNLTEYMNERKSTPFDVQAFTNLDSLSEFAAKHHIELLLISTQAMCDEVKKLDIDRIVILSEGELPEHALSEPQVYKYQSSDNLIAEVMNYYAASVPCPQPAVFAGTALKTELVAVYSPLGRLGKTTFALTLGEILAEKKKVLYVNLEDYHGFEGVFTSACRADLSDLIYFARQKEGNIIYKLNGMIQTFHNLDYIPPAFSPCDLRDVGYEEWIWFLREVGLSGEYDILILDLGYQVDEVYQLLRQCSRIYMPVLEDTISKSKLLQFEKNLNALDCQEVLERLHRLHLPEVRAEPGGKDGIERLINGSMGAYVRKLLEKTDRR